MNTLSWKNLILPLCVPVLLAACSASKKATVTSPRPVTLPELPVSEIDIPVSVDARPILEKAEKTVPTEFTSAGWPAFTQPSCDFRYKYRFVRSPLQVAVANNVVSIRFGGNYQVGGSKCICTAGISVSPWISGGCGFSPQPLRKVNMGLRSTIQVLPAYRLRSQTVVTGIQPLDKCLVSVFSNDITQLVMDSIRSSLNDFSSSMDKTIGALDFTSFVQRIKDSSFRRVALGKYGYLLLNPSGMRMGQLNYTADSFRFSFGLSCKPSLGSESHNSGVVPAAMPPMLQTENRRGIKLYFNLQYDYGFLNKLIDDSLHNRVFEVNGRTIVIKDAVVSGMENNEMTIRIDFAGSNHGSVFLTGTPVLDTASQTLSIPDIHYSLEDADLALKIARSLFRNKIRKTIQGKSYLDIRALAASNKVSIDQQLNRELTKGIFLHGQLNEVRVLAMLVTKENIQLQVFIKADLALAAGNL